MTNGNGSKAVQALRAIKDKGISATSKPATVAIPAAKIIGTPIAIVNTKIKPIINGPLIMVNLSILYFSIANKLAKF